MYEESQLIPSQTSPVPSGKSIVFAPHPDDETFGLGGTILKMTAQGNKVVTVLVTDGSKAGNPETRKNEFIAATQALGVYKNYFLDFIDRDIDINSRTIRSVSEIIIKENPENILFTSPFEYHIDHRATAWLVWSSLVQLNFKGNVFSYEVGNQSPANKFIDITDVIARKNEIMSIYISQRSFNDYPRKIISINESRSYTLPSEVKYAEALFQFNSLNNDLTTAYHENQIAFENGFSQLSNPKVSVLIRTQNRPDLLSKALTSVIKQTYSNIEINCLNDGGKSVENITEHFSINNIKLLENKHPKGRSAAANQLLSMATGDYLIFLDDDDTYDPEHIETLVNELIKNPNVKVTYSGIRVGNSELLSKSYNHPYSAARLRHSNYIPIHAVLFSRELLDIGCRFDERFDIYEDWDFWLQLSQETAFLHINKITATYNVHGNSGAGESGLRIDEREWKFKIYDKWMKRWSPQQLEETFQEIHSTSASQNQISLRNEVVALRSLKEKEDQLSSLESDRQRLNSQLINQNKWSSYILDQLVMSHVPSQYSNYRISSARPHIADCRKLFKEVFLQDISEEFWEWKYQGAHWRAVCAMDKNDKVVGFYGGMLRRILVFGELKIALQACDTMISPEARTMMGRNSLFNLLYSTWQSINFNHNSDLFIGYGFPHKRVFNLAQKIGNYKEIDRINEVIWDLDTPVDIDTKSERLLDSNRISRHWKSMKIDFKDKVLAVRDENYIEERYINHPVNNYEIYIIKDTNNQEIGVAILKEGNDSYSLIDIVSEKKYFQKVILQICSQIKDSSKSKLTAWVTKSCSSLFDMPNSNIKQTDIFIPGIGPKGKGHEESTKESWFLMYGDTDFL